LHRDALTRQMQDGRTIHLPLPDELGPLLSAEVVLRPKK